MPTKTPTKPKAPAVPEVADPITPTDDDISKILAEHVTNTPTGLIFDGSLKFEDWMKTYNFYLLVHNKSAWLLGDCLRHGEVYGERYAQAVDIGKSTSYLSSIVSICGRFADLSRRREKLSFDHHAAVAYLPPQTADTILDQAEKLHWGRDEVRDAAAKAKGLPTKAQKAAAKQAKIDGQIKLLPPAANPPTIDVHMTVEKTATDAQKGYIWNGHPVTTRDGLLYAGTEMLPSPEADSCARVHGFNHAENMVKALEAAKQPETAAPAPAQPVPTPSPAPVEPKSTPTAPSLASTQDQPVAIERCQAALNRFEEATREVDWNAFTPLSRKSWLKKLIFADNLIDLLQGEPPTPRK